MKAAIHRNDGARGKGEISLEDGFDGQPDVEPAGSGGVAFEIHVLQYRSRRRGAPDAPDVPDVKGRVWMSWGIP